MIDVLPGLWSLSPLAALVGVIVTLFLLLAYGKLITKSSLERELMNQEKSNTLVLEQANKRGDEWKETALAGREVITEQSHQIGALIESGKTAAQFFGTVGGDDRVGKAPN